VSPSCRCACTISLHFTVQVKYNSLEQWNAISLVTYCAGAQ
jgi:hypothetical protein